MAENLLEVNNLKTYFFSRAGVVKAVDDVSFHVRQGETLSHSMSRTGGFVPLVVHMTAVGEETGRLAGMLVRTADTLDFEGEFYRFIIIRPEGTFATIVAIDGRDRFRFSVVGTAEMRSYSEEEVRQAIITAFGKPFDFEILSIMPWIRRELVADRFGSGRVFIAGDAAHLTSPTGGFGPRGRAGPDSGRRWA